MELNKIDPEKLNSDPETQSLWFRSDDGDLYIIFKKNELSFFEITFENNHIEGGLNRELRYGLINGPEDELDTPFYKLSRLVEFHNEIPEEIIKKCVKLVHACNDLERIIKDGIMEFISSNGEKDYLLKSDSDYESFREIVETPKTSLEYFKKYKNTIKNSFLALMLIIVLCATYFAFNFDGGPEAQDKCLAGDDNACREVSYSLFVKGHFSSSSHFYTKAKKIKNTKSLAIAKKDCSNGKLEGCRKYLENLENVNERELKSVCKNGELDKRACLKLAIKYSKDLWNLTSENFKDHKSYAYYKYASSKEKDYTKPIVDFYLNKESCSAGVLSDCKLFGAELLNHGHKKKASEVFQMLCDQDVSESCLQAGLISENKDVGVRNIFKACKANDYKACAYFHSIEETTILNESEARRSLRECLKGNESSCKALRNIEF